MKKLLRFVGILLALIGLAVVVLIASSFFSSKKTFKDAERRSKVQTVASSARKFYVENQRFPRNMDELIQNGYIDESYKSIKPAVVYSWSKSEKGEDCIVVIKLQSGDLFKETCSGGMGF